LLRKSDKIFVAGHTGMAGSAIVRRLKDEGYSQLVTRKHSELDLTRQRAVENFFLQQPIDVVFLAAAKVGGIMANDSLRADFIYQNLMIAANVIHAAWRAGVKRLLFLGSSCVYPKNCPQPMREEYLLSGSLEPTNEPYAIAKIAGIKLCESYNRQYGTLYRCVMPTNLYGPNDNFDLTGSHVLAALVRKFHLAKLALQNDRQGIEKDASTHGPIPADVLEAPGLDENPPEAPLRPTVRLWGTGRPRREFLHVDDMAAACLQVMRLSDEEYDSLRRAGPAATESVGGAPAAVSHVNVGCGWDLTIRELAETIKKVVGYDGPVAWDRGKPDGMAVKRLDISRISSIGWASTIGLEEGIRQTYEWYCSR
jgi:GDP-L-fucose synthase